MARGRPPKPDHMRAGHQAKASTRAILVAGANANAHPPRLPPHPSGEKWHPMSVRTWKAIWRSPMASQFLDADFLGIFRVVVLTQAFLKTPTASISAELRQLGYTLGLSPMDRKRLQWVIAKADGAGDMAERRRAASARIIEQDPRDTLGDMDRQG